MSIVSVRTQDGRVKGVRMEDLPEDAWRVISGGEHSGDYEQLYRDVPWLFRGIELRHNAVASMPFTIYRGRGGAVLDESTAYENKVGFLPNPGELLGLVEMALSVWGYAYLENGRNLAQKTRELFYLLPPTVRPKWKETSAGIKTGELEAWERDIGGRVVKLDPEDLVYFWKPDPFVEKGPPRSSPLKAAAGAANVLINVDAFAAAFAKRGMVKTVMIGLEGNPPEAEMERVEGIFQRVTQGIKNAFRPIFIRQSAGVHPAIIGEGLEALRDNNLTNEKREAIATAIGVPHTMLFSSAAKGLGGGGVATQDEVNFYNQTIVPECRFLERVLNRQLFNPLDYHFKFNEQSLDIYQEDEAQRASALTSVQTALTEPEEFLIAAQILGYELDPEVMQKIEKLAADREKRRQEMQQQLGGNGQPDNQPPDDQSPFERQDDDEDEQDEKAADLDKWKRKAEKALKRGEPAAVNFVSDHIPADLHARIALALQECKTVDDVRRAFLLPDEGAQPGDLSSLVDVLKRLDAKLESVDGA